MQTYYEFINEELKDLKKLAISGSEEGILKLVAKYFYSKPENYKLIQDDKNIYAKNTYFIKSLVKDKLLDYFIVQQKGKKWYFYESTDVKH